MAFAIVYNEDKYPISKTFHSDDPMKDFRGSNKIDPRHKWKTININVGEVKTAPLVSTFTNRAGNSHKGIEKGVREIELEFDIIIDGLYQSQFFEEFAEQVFDTDKPFMFYRDLRPEGRRFKDVPPNNIGYSVMKTAFSTELVARHKVRVSVTLETVGLPYGISYGSTKDIIDSGNELTFSSGVFGWHQNLKFDEDTHPYRKRIRDGETVRFFNPSMKKVRHYEACMYVKLFNFAYYKGGVITLKNVTNGTNFDVDTNVNVNDIIEQKDNTIFKNGLNEMQKTNWRFIELEKGWNEFTLTGVDAEVYLDFKLYN